MTEPVTEPHGRPISEPHGGMHVHNIKYKSKRVADYFILPKCFHVL